MTSEDRIKAIAELGFTERQARFLECRRRDPVWPWAERGHHASGRQWRSADRRHGP